MPGLPLSVLPAPCIITITGDAGMRRRNTTAFLEKFPIIWYCGSLGNARLCISASHVETPGISNLEAAALGCSLLLPDIEPIREYFGDLVEYLPSGALDFSQLPQLVQRQPSPDLRLKILNNYSEAVVKNKFEQLDIPKRVMI